jgi:hypothetical protein
MTINEQHGAGARPDPMDPQRVEWNATGGGSTKINTAHNLLGAVVKEQGNYYSAIAHLEGDMTPEGFDKQRKAFGTTRAAGQVDAAEQLAAGRTAELQAQLDQAITAHNRAGDAAAESRALRTAGQIERQMAGLDAGRKAVAARRMIAEADPETRAVLYQELPSHGVSRDIVTQAVVDSDPSLKNTQAKLAQSRKAELLIKADAARVRAAIDAGRLPYVGLTNPAPYDPDA